jgi:hypothetical protein
MALLVKKSLTGTEQELLVLLLKYEDFILRTLMSLPRWPDVDRIASSLVQEITDYKTDFVHGEFITDFGTNATHSWNKIPTSEIIIDFTRIRFMNTGFDPRECKLARVKRSAPYIIRPEAEEIHKRYVSAV